ncbi:MAG: hypothetical protein KGR26_06875 [Cyanobacteria bacterium REEB65]|nr:hypothetical protein [Cyanobacteria bacterium REEB65]
MPCLSEALAKLESQRSELASLSTDRLREELLHALQWTSEGLVRIALIVRTLEERGEDLSGMRVSLLPYLRQIAYGQILPEVIVRFGESPLLVRHVSHLPLPDQARLAAGESVPMAIRRDDGTIDQRQVDPLYLRREQVALVFARDRVRPLEEQIILLESRPADRKTATPVATAAIRPDRQRNGLVLHRTFVPVADVLAALAALRSGSGTDHADDDEPGDRKQLVVPLTEGQHDRLRQAAHDSRTSMATLARHALIAHGLI